MRADPQVLAQRLQMGAGVVLMLVAGYLGVTGRLFAAIPLAFFAAGLLGWLPRPASIGARMRKTPGQVSRVRASAVEMELDHDTGDMRGKILTGKYQDVPLDALDRADADRPARRSGRREPRATRSLSGPPGRRMA